jgi:hypothetical protein
MDRDILDSIEKRKIPVYVVAEDPLTAGSVASSWYPPSNFLPRTALPGPFAEYDLVTHW